MCSCLRQVLLCLNILAVNMADRGSAVAPVLVDYPEATLFGKTVRVPFPLARSVKAPPSQLNA